MKPAVESFLTWIPIPFVGMILFVAFEDSFNANRWVNMAKLALHSFTVVLSAPAILYVLNRM